MELEHDIAMCSDLHLSYIYDYVIKGKDTLLCSMFYHEEMKCDINKILQKYPNMQIIDTFNTQHISLNDNKVYHKVSNIKPKK